MVDLARMLTATRGRGRPDWTDWLTYGYLVLGLGLMFGPVLWLVASSFKTAAALNEFPPRLLPYGQSMVAVPGHTDALPLFRVKLPDGTTRELVEVRRIGIEATMADPKKPDEEFKVNIRDRERREFHLATETAPDFRQLNFARLEQRLHVVIATLITLLFVRWHVALSKYRLEGRWWCSCDPSTLMIPPTIIRCRTSGRLGVGPLNSPGASSGRWRLRPPAYSCCAYMLTILDG